MSATVKIGAVDLPVEGTGPLVARSVQYGGSTPGGHGSASFDVYVADAYQQPHHVLRKGNWIRIDDDGHELYEGEVFSVVPVVEVGGQHKFTVTCGGIMAVAARREDVSQTWCHRGGIGWQVALGGNKAGEYTLDKEGILELRVRQGATEYFLTPMSALWWLDDRLSAGTISSIDYTIVWDVTSEPSGRTWGWYLYGGGMLRTEGNTSGTASGTWTPTAGTVSLNLALYSVSTEATVSADKYVSFTKLDVFSSGRTTKARIDEAMVSLATRTGLATSFVSLPIGLAYDDLAVKSVSAAGGLDYLAGLHAQPFDHGFWDNKTFYCRPLERTPSNPAKVIVVGGGKPGLTSWNVVPQDEDVPDYVRVLFGNKDDPYVPEGFVRSLYAPCTPPDTADLDVPTVDFSGLILSDSAAVAAASNLIGANSTEIPGGACFDAHPEMAKNSVAAGNNADPTSAYAQTLPDGATGTLTTFAYTAASGWAGSNSPADPTCLVFDGSSDYVTWGDLALTDFGTGAFSVSVWFKLNALGATQTLFGKMTATFGWALLVSDTDNLVGLLRADTGHGHLQGCSTVLRSGVWYHAGITYPGTGGAMILYLNGVAATLFYDLHSDALAAGTSNAASLKLGAN